MRVQLMMALRYLRGRKLRSALTTLAVVFGVAVLFGMNSLLPTLTQAFRQTVLATTGKVDLIFTSVTEGTFPADRMEVVRGVDGVAEVAGSLHRNVLLPPALAGRAGVNALTLVGVEPEVAARLRHYPLREGRFLAPDDADAIVISRGLADKLALSVGDTLTLPSATGTTDFEVVGVLDVPSLPGTEEVYVPLPAAQRLLGMPGQINVIEAVVKPGVDREEVEKAALAALGDTFKPEPPEMGEELLASLQMGEIAFALFGVMALAIGAFIILNTFRTVVVERRHDLGMLRAIGASRRAVVGLVLAESLLQGVFGTALGLVGGYGLAWLLLLMVRPTMQQYLRMEATTPVLTLPNLLTAVVLGIGATLAGGLWPALSAGRVTPLEALRPVVPGAYERAARRRGIAGAVLLVLAALALLTGDFNLAALGTLLFLVGLVLVAPALVSPLARLFGRLLALIFAREGRLAEGNLARQPNRAAVTASALMVGLAMILALAGMVSSLFDGFMSYLDHSLHTDFLLMPASLVLSGGNVGAGPELVEAVRSVPGVTGATTLRLGTAAVDGATLQVIGVDPETYPRLSGLVFRYGDPEEAFAALGRERAIIVNGIFAAQRQVKVGDVLTLQTPEGKREYRVVGVGSDYLNAKLATGYISQANLERDFHQTADLLVMVEAAEGRRYGRGGGEVTGNRRAVPVLRADGVAVVPGGAAAGLQPEHLPAERDYGDVRAAVASGDGEHADDQRDGADARDRRPAGGGEHAAAGAADDCGGESAPGRAGDGLRDSGGPLAGVRPDAGDGCERFRDALLLPVHGSPAGGGRGAAHWRGGGGAAGAPGGPSGHRGRAAV
jgi:putative ABC transport system permease protein